MRAPLLLLLVLLAAAPVFADPIQPTSGSPYADHRASRTGDSVTLVIRDATAVVQSLDNRTTEGTQVSVPNLGALLTGFFLPSLQSATTTGTRVQENQAHRFEATLTCKVVQVLDNGDLRVEGRRSVTLNGDRQGLTLRGVVRPDDLGPDNTVESSRLSDLEVDYQGPLTGQARAGLIRTILQM